MINKNMNIYQLPTIEIKNLKTPKTKKLFKPGQRKGIQFWVLLFFFIGVLVGFSFTYYLYYDLKQEIVKAGVPLTIVEEKNNVSQQYVPQTTEEERVIKVVKEAYPSVVSIIITKDIPKYDFFWIFSRKRKSKSWSREWVYCLF